MGIGHLRFVDRDIVSRSDLHRQHLYDAESLGRPKVEVACEKLSRLNPDVTLEPVPESLNSTNAEELISGMDIVVDGLLVTGRGYGQNTGVLKEFIRMLQGR